MQSWQFLFNLISFEYMIFKCQRRWQQFYAENSNFNCNYGACFFFSPLHSLGIRLHYFIIFNQTWRLTALFFDFMHITSHSLFNILHDKIYEDKRKISIPSTLLMKTYSWAIFDSFLFVQCWNPFGSGASARENLFAWFSRSSSCDLLCSSRKMSVFLYKIFDMSDVENHFHFHIP